jgi:hypothetical protein
MIRVLPKGPPDDFDSNCRGPGNAWLAANPDTDPHTHPLWTKYIDKLRTAFETRCGFLAMRIPRGTVDHWISIKTDRTRAYEWSNYRFVGSEVNSAKKPSWEGKLLDPFEVQDGWFEILLPSLQLVIADIPDEAARSRAEFTLEKLHLQNGEDIVRQRREWMQLYEEGLPLDSLRKVAPLLARAVEKREGKLSSAR